MPKIVRFHKTGGPENLKIEDAPSAEPGKGEVRLRVHAAGLNRGESYVRILLDKVWDNYAEAGIEII